MRHTAGIALVVTLSLFGGYWGLALWLRDGGALSPRAARAAPSVATWLEEAAEVPPRARRPGESLAESTVTVRNDMPATITVLTRPDGRTYRLGWGGGDLVLGPGPVDALAVLYHDPYWPYVYAVTWPAADRDLCVRMSDLWHGRCPAGAAVWRGRPDRAGIVWFDSAEETGPGREPARELAAEAPTADRG